LANGCQEVKGLWDIQSMIRSPKSSGHGTQAESSEPNGR